MSKKILVTGGTGYIGSHTVVELLNNDFEVIIVDDLSNSEKFILNNIEEVSGKKPIFYPFDLRRKELLSQVFEAHNIEGCINFAASKAACARLIFALATSVCFEATFVLETTAFF